MASIKKRPNGKYRARYRDPEGKEHARHFDRRKDAETWISRQVVKVTDGTWVDPEQGRRTFKEYATEWQTAQVHHRASTQQITGYRLATLIDQFGERPIAAITRTEVQAWVKSLTVAPSSVEALYRLLAQVMLAAVHDQKITSSPCNRVNLPSRDGERITIPSPEEVAAIVGSASARGRATVVLAAGSGLRVSEMLGLTVDRVDWLRGVITVDRQLVGIKAGRPVFGPPKTKASVRQVPVPLELVGALAAHLAEFPSDGLLFTTSTGAPWRRGAHWEEWKRWSTKAGVSVRLHDLRHFYASSLIAAGQSVKVVQDRLGHASAATTLDVYGHLWGDDEDRTREAVAGALGTVLRTARGQQDANSLVRDL